MSSVLTWFFIFGVVQIIVLLLIFIGIPLLLLRFIFGRGGGAGNSSSGGRSSPVQQPTRRRWGFPTRMYTGSPKLSDFSVDPEVYNFRTPKPIPNLDRLRSKANIDTEKARELFVGGSVTRGPLDLPNYMLDMEKARELFLPRQSGLLDFVYPEEDEDGIDLEE